MAMARTAHAMKTCAVRFSNRSMAQTFCHARVALADAGGFFAMDCVVGMSLPAVSVVSVVSMQRGLA